MFGLVNMFNLLTHLCYRLKLFMNEITDANNIEYRKTGAIKNIQVYGRYMILGSEKD